jgi:hypothetical protein
MIFIFYLNDRLSGCALLDVIDRTFAFGDNDIKSDWRVLA